MRWSRPSIPSPRPVRKETLIGFLLLFFTSGACGLIYEVAWQRMLCLVFGNSTFATSTVLAAFMGGMALGSFALGKLSEKARNPARLFAYLEMGIGIWALAMPSLLASASSFHSALYRSLVSHYFLLNISRFAVCFLILAVPTALMGGTLPALARALTGGEVGRSVGLLYGLNTLGIGTEATITLAASFSLAVGLASLFMSRGCSVVRVEVEPGRGRTLALVAYAVSGFCALSYEVLWTRALVFFFGSTTYAFTIRDGGGTRSCSPPHRGGGPFVRGEMGGGHSRGRGSNEGLEEAMDGEVQGHVQERPAYRIGVRRLGLPRILEELP